MRIFKEFHFEAAHRLPHVPAGHKCGRTHGHNYKIRIEVLGQVYPRSGWVMDFGEIGAVVKPVIEELDHQTLNDIPGLDNPTAEVLARYIWDKVFSSIPWLSRVEVWETPDAGAIWCGGRE